MSKNDKLNPNDGMTYKLWNLCACGCGELVRNVFKQGHDMRMRLSWSK